jgi:hypothetical protein
MEWRGISRGTAYQVRVLPIMVRLSRLHRSGLWKRLDFPVGHACPIKARRSGSTCHKAQQFPRFQSSTRCRRSRTHYPLLLVHPLGTHVPAHSGAKHFSVNLRLTFSRSPGITVTKDLIGVEPATPVWKSNTFARYTSRRHYLGVGR